MDLTDCISYAESAVRMRGIYPEKPNAESELVKPALNPFFDIVTKCQ
jgi:hypothetical protein